jgi:hypothetical protein
MGYQTAAPEFRHNSLYTFNIDPNTSDVIVMNTQTGHLYRCTKDLQCDAELEEQFKKPLK